MLSQESVMCTLCSMLSASGTRGPSCREQARRKTLTCRGHSRKIRSARKSFCTSCISIALFLLASSRSTELHAEGRTPISGKTSRFYQVIGSEACEKKLERNLDKDDSPLLQRALKDIIKRVLMPEECRKTVLGRERVRELYVIYPERLGLGKSSIKIHYVHSVEPLYELARAREPKSVYYVWPELINAVILPNMPDCERSLLVSLRIGGVMLDPVMGIRPWADEMPFYTVCETRREILYFRDTRGGS